MSVVDIAKPAAAEARRGGAAKKGGQEEADPDPGGRAAPSAAAPTGSCSSRKPAEQPPKPGAVVTLDPIQINLADEHYLKVGIALQLARTRARRPTAARRWTPTIDLFSGQSMEDLTRRALPRQAEEGARAPPRRGSTRAR